MAYPSRGEFHITVVSTPKPSVVEIIQHDLNMTKAAILYADRIKIYSHGLSTLLKAVSVSEEGISDVERIERLIDTKIGSDVPIPQDAAEILDGAVRARPLFRRKKILLTRRERDADGERWRISGILDASWKVGMGRVVMGECTNS